MDNSNLTNGESFQRDLLDQDENIELQYIPASQGQRFLNWLIDNLLMQFGLSYLTGFALGIIINEINPEFLYDVVYGEDKGKLLLFSYLVGIFNYLIYYTLCEKLFKGHTLGKAITGSRAIKQNGSELTFKDAFLRSLSRLVPFEVFSGFGTYTWHDQWTNTMVINKK